MSTQPKRSQIVLTRKRAELLLRVVRHLHISSINKLYSIIHCLAYYLATLLTKLLAISRRTWEEPKHTSRPRAIVSNFQYDALPSGGTITTFSSKEDHQRLDIRCHIFIIIPLDNKSTIYYYPKRNHRLMSHLSSL